MIPPWEAIPYFQNVTETTFVGNSTVQQIAGFDPMRVAILFANNTSANTIGVSTSPNAQAKKGILLTTQNTNVWFTQAEFGPLVNSAWYFNDAAGTSVTVITVSLAKWPLGGKANE